MEGGNRNGKKGHQGKLRAWVESLPFSEAVEEPHLKASI